MTYSYISLRDDSNPNSRINKNNGKTHRNEPQYAVYIALSVFRYIPYNTEDSIKSEIERMANNISDKTDKEILKIRDDAWDELTGLKITTTINKHGKIKEKINENYTEKQKNYHALQSITTAIEFIKDYIYVTGPLKDTMKDHFFNMITHFDNNNKNKTNLNDRNEIAYDTKMNFKDPTLTEREKRINYIINEYNKINKHNQLTKITAQNAPAQNAPAQNAPAQTPVRVEKPNHNANTKKIIGEHIAYQLIIDGHLYNEDAQIDLIAYYRNIFNVETPEIEDEKGFKIMTYCSNILNNETILSGNNDFNFHQIFNFEKFAENIVNYKLDKIDKIFFYKETKKIGSDIYGDLNALNNILIDNNDNGISRKTLKYIVQNGIDNKDIKHKEINQKNKKDKNYSNKPIEDNNDDIKEKTILEKFLKWSKIK